MKRARQAKGSVKLWHDGEGWGVLTSADVPDDVWASFSAIEGSGWKNLNVGEQVEFRYRPTQSKGSQDGYSYIAESIRRL